MKRERKEQYRGLFLHIEFMLRYSIFQELRSLPNVKAATTGTRNFVHNTWIKIEGEFILSFRKKFCWTVLCSLKVIQFLGSRSLRIGLMIVSAPFYKRDRVEFFNLVGLRYVRRVKLENIVNECWRITITV